jgi:hypothetical protein
MSIQFASSASRRAWIAHSLGAVVVAFWLGLFTNSVPAAERAGFSIQKFCADPTAHMSELEKALRPRMRLSTSDRNYDELRSRVLWRIAQNCLKGPNPEFHVNLDLYVRNSRIEIHREEHAIEYRDEIMEVIPPKSSVSSEEILDAMQKKGDAETADDF